MALSLLNSASRSAPQQVCGSVPHQNNAKKEKGKSIMMNFIKDESGATAIEYGLLAALISIAALASMKIVGTKLSSTFSKVGASLS